MLEAFICVLRENMGEYKNDWPALEAQARYQSLPSNALVNAPAPQNRGVRPDRALNSSPSGLSLVTASCPSVDSYSNHLSTALYISAISLGAGDRENTHQSSVLMIHIYSRRKQIINEHVNI